jgi:hypothetical protein
VLRLKKQVDLQSEEECKFTNGEDEEPEFNESTFQKLFTGTNNISIDDSKGPRLLVHRYQRGSHSNIRTQQRAKKEHMSYDWQQWILGH